jgi:hypothetical protein
MEERQVFLVTLKLSTTPLYEIYSPKGLNIVILNPSIGNRTPHGFRRGLCQTMGKT